MNDAQLGLLAPAFEPARFDAALAASGDRIALFRGAIAAGTARLAEQFDAGVRINDLIRARSLLIDALLTRAWRLYFPADCQAALIAVGGYGRGELHPASDVDIMVLLGATPAEALQGAIEGLLTFCWDIGLEIGHSVRSLDDCVREAAADITVTTNLLEARLLWGPRALFEAMQQRTGPDAIWPSRRFFKAKWKEQKERHAKFDDTAYNLEPNVKEGPGGLRDIQMIDWVAKRRFGTTRMHGLVDHGFITEAEYRSLKEGQAFLWRVRFALHRLTGRREDRLLFDYQRTLADQFGFSDADHNLAVEQFMQRYYRTIKELAQLNDMLLQHFEEAILLENALDPPSPINRRFQARNGYIEATHEWVFARAPVALLEIFLLLASRDELKGIRASTIRLIRSHLHLIDKRFRMDVRAASLFMEIMRQPRRVLRILRRMNRYGVLPAYIPAFANIVGRMQYDLFHVYTVDEHTLRVVRNLRRFAIPRYRDEFPFCSDIMETIPKPELLYLAALFHDIAKGRRGDHSKLGALDARAFCRLHHLSEFDSNLVAWLVEHHLLLSITAQRKDISDPEVVQEFAERVADPVRLDYLYLLTVADVRATNPKRWTSWINSLLRDLYDSAHRALQRGLDNPLAQDELIQAKQAEVRRMLAERGIAVERTQRLWVKFNIEYFLYYTPEEIVWHLIRIDRTGPDDLPLVTVRNEKRRGGTAVFVYDYDRDGKFALVTSVLGQQRLSIVDARILTTDDGMTLDTFLVLDESGAPIETIARRDQILDALVKALRKPPPEIPRPNQRLPRQHKHFETRTLVQFGQDERNHRTVMRLVTKDRPGLLADIGQVFSELGLRLHNAKITTLGVEVDDVFFLTDRHNRPLHSEALLERLRVTLTEQLGRQAA